jgi:hypothetical protein
VREALIAFLQQRYPEALPSTRIEAPTLAQAINGTRTIAEQLTARP